ncbi:MAG: ABC transporter permease [Rhodoferax sp.]
MRARSLATIAPGAWGFRLVRTLASWWHLIRFFAIVMVIALSPSSYKRSNRATISRYIYISTWQVLPWFTALAALLSVVLIRIVVATALSYGLSQYALQMVVRVLVLELIPLSAALFVALRSGLAFNAGAAANNASDRAFSTLRPSLEGLRGQLLPQVLADAFSVLALATVSSAIALVLAYLTVHGPSLWGLPGYTRTVGQVFDLAVTLGFGMKTLFFSLAVAVVPVAARLEAQGPGASSVTLQPGSVRLFLVLLLIETTSLVVKYI